MYAVGVDNYGVGSGNTPSDPDSYSGFAQYEEEVTLPDGYCSFVVADYRGYGMGWKWVIFPCS